ncbi:MAG: antA/AntB antirepressor family protein [Candidatus Omnitrophica bacterium]|nr:antA/AntB antirepressor family protein [Candidatus Omnitrophota bacterium]
MNELIKITENDKGEKLVSARELHEYLGNKRQFADWMNQRILQYGFIENQDYTSFHSFVKRKVGASKRIEYAITLDMAKELAMVENNEKGKIARQYFIAVEKEAIRRLLFSKHPAVPTTFAEALELAAKQQREIETQKREILVLAPKADFADKVILVDGLIEMSMAVKLLKLPYGRNIFFKLLRFSGVFFKSRNEPLQKYIEMGYFQVKQKVITRTELPDMIVNVPFFTEKGMARMAGWLTQRGFYDKKNVKDYIAQKEKENELSFAR